MSIILPLLLGVVFGFALNKAGLTKYHKIVNQFRLNDMAVLKFMLTALVVAMLGLYPLHALGVINFPTVPATYVVGNLVGGLIFGVGMALAGFCPGTCVAGAGEGKVDYLVPGILGFLIGAIAAFILGGPAGLLLACALVFLVRLINFILYPSAQIPSRGRPGSVSTRDPDVQQRLPADNTPLAK